jgi:hypothetical protein
MFKDVFIKSKIGISIIGIYKIISKKPIIVNTIIVIEEIFLKNPMLVL